MEEDRTLQLDCYRARGEFGKFAIYKILNAVTQESLQVVWWGQPGSKEQPFIKCSIPVTQVKLSPAEFLHS